MNKKQIIRYGIVFILAGIVIGIILSANFDMSRQIQAESNTPQVQESQPPQSMGRNADDTMELLELSEQDQNTSLDMVQVAALSPEKRISTT